jgi:hypothetical protein
MRQRLYNQPLLCCVSLTKSSKKTVVTPLNRGRGRVVTPASWSDNALDQVGLFDRWRGAKVTALAIQAGGNSAVVWPIKILAAGRLVGIDFNRRMAKWPDT